MCSKNMTLKSVKPVIQIFYFRSHMIKTQQTPYKLGGKKTFLNGNWIVLNQNSSKTFRKCFQLFTGKTTMTEK